MSAPGVPLTSQGRVLQLANGPAERGPGSCSHNYIVFKEGDKTIYRCTKCGHTIR